MDNSDSGVWIPSGLPKNARVFQLQANSKRPPKGYLGAHHRACPIDEAMLIRGDHGSYGISLEKQFVLVDLDSDDETAVAMFDALPATWEQRTWSGKRHKLYLQPQGFDGKNVVWKTPAGVRIGELKPHGYGVGPESTVNDRVYARTNALEPVMAPPEILALCTEAMSPPPPGEGQSRIPQYERDNFMARLSGLFARYGYDEACRFHAFNAMRQSPAMEQPEGFPWTEDDARRVAKSGNRYQMQLEAGRLIPEGWTCFSDIRLIRPPFDWWVPEFIPVGELLTSYGSKSRGKSTFWGWVAAQVTQQGGVFGFIGIEEPSWRFGLRAAMMGADREKMVNCDNAEILKLPRDAAKLREAIEIQKLDFLYIDAIYEHFEAAKNENAAQQARHALSPLALIAQQTGCTIVGNFHENKEGALLGSVEMENVGRGILHIMRRKNSTHTYVGIKSNFGDDNELLHFIGHKMDLCDPLTGEYQMQRLKDGTLKHRQDWILEQQANVPIKGEGEEPPLEEINLGDVKDPEPAKKASARPRPGEGPSLL